MSDVIQVNPLVFGGNGGVEIPFMTKLWENPSPTSEFAAQTINLASGDYDFLLWIYQYKLGVERTLAQISSKGNGTILSYIISSTIRTRTITRVSDTSFNAGDGSTDDVDSSASITIDNTVSVPLTIYGFKKSYAIEDVAIANVSTSATQCIMSDNVTTVEQAINAINNFEATDITYNGAITTGTAVDLDSSKDYRNALAITILYQDNVSNNVSGIAYANRGTGHLMFMPSITSTTTKIRIRILWLKA